MIARAPMRRRRSTIAPAQIAAPSLDASGGGASRDAPDFGREPRRLAEHDAVLHDDAVAEHHAVVDDDVGAEGDVGADGGGRAEDEPGGGVIGHGGYPSGAVGSQDSTRPLRGAVLGLGMMGRHHARILQSYPAVALRRRRRSRRRPLRRRPRRRAGSSRPRRAARAPGGARLRDRRRADRGAPRAVRELAAAGVHVLVEKPLAATAEEARELIGVVPGARASTRAVGHVERFNPALLALRARVQEGQLGELFLVATERIGPFPDRVRDVGVIKDLATHDLDLVRWLGGAPIERVAAADPAPHGPRARGPRARDRPPGERRALQLDRRLADADQGAPHARAGRARDARRRHADAPT